MKISDEKPVVLVTGFGPFQNYDVNPASVTLKVLEQLQFPREIQLVTKEIPVEYETVSRELPKLWGEYHPKVKIYSNLDCVLLTVALRFRFSSLCTSVLVLKVNVYL